MTRHKVPHVHVESSSRDCDGRYSYSATARPRPEDLECVYSGSERTPEDIARSIVETSVARAIPLYGSQDVTVNVRTFGSWDDDDEGLSVTVSYPTDEGSYSITFTTCQHDYCANDPSSSRDYTAEAAGY